MYLSIDSELGHARLGHPSLGRLNTWHSDLADSVRSGTYNPPVEAVVVSVMAWLCDLSQTSVPRAGEDVREP